MTTIFKKGNKLGKYTLKKDIRIKLTETEAEGQKVFIGENRHLNIIWEVEETLEELLETIKESLIFDFEDIALEQDNKLSPMAIKLKRTLLRYIGKGEK
jgi:hypothetical protein